MGFCCGRPETTALQKCGSGFQKTDRKDSCMRSRLPSVIMVVVCGPELELEATRKDSTEGPCAKQARPRESPCFGTLHSETKGNRCSVSVSGRQTGRVRPGPRGCSVEGEGQGVAGGSRGPLVQQMQQGALPPLRSPCCPAEGPGCGSPPGLRVLALCLPAVVLGPLCLQRGLGTGLWLPGQRGGLRHCPPCDCPWSSVA